MHEFRGKSSKRKYFSRYAQPFSIDGPLEDFGGMVIRPVLGKIATLLPMRART
jgi:hypothetical protein